MKRLKETLTGLLLLAGYFFAIGLAQFVEQLT